MDLSTSKLELIELILSSTDVELLQEMKTLFNPTQKLSAEHYKELDKRREAYQKDKSTAMPWIEVKQKILKQTE